MKEIHERSGLTLKILYLSRSLLPSQTANSVQVMKMCQVLVQLVP